MVVCSYVPLFCLTFRLFGSWLLAFHNFDILLWFQRGVHHITFGILINIIPWRIKSGTSFRCEPLMDFIFISCHHFELYSRFDKTVASTFWHWQRFLYLSQSISQFWLLYFRFALFSIIFSSLLLYTYWGSFWKGGYPLRIFPYRCDLQAWVCGLVCLYATVVAKGP